MSTAAQRFGLESDIGDFPAPGTMDLPAGQVDIWFMAIPSGGMAGQAPVLSEDERLRAQSLRVARQWEQFIAARSALRRILSAYVDRQPETLTFGKNAWGKPYLASPHDGPQFNLSHSGDQVVIAVSAEAVGVDIEEIRPDPPFEIIPLILTDQERTQLMTCSATMRPEIFYRFWSAKEAVAKGIGRGLDIDFRQIGIDGDLESEGSEALLSFKNMAAERWFLHSLPCAAGFSASLASPCQHLSILFRSIGSPFLRN